MALNNRIGLVVRARSCWCDDRHRVGSLGVGIGVRDGDGLGACQGGGYWVMEVELWVLVIRLVGGERERMEVVVRECGMNWGVVLDDAHFDKRVWRSGTDTGLSSF